MDKTKKVNSPEDCFEITADEKDLIIIERQLVKYTKLDIEIHNLPIPKKPIWLNYIVRSIRYYQERISHKLGNRCVFDPSCSHYSELAFRKKGFLKGTFFTVKRLLRCRAKNGGVDLIT